MDKYISFNRTKISTEIKLKEGLINITTAENVMSFLSKEPSADVQEIKHGKWIEQSRGFYSCSCCGRIEHLNGLMVTEKNKNQLLHSMYPYCHCGAKMDGE